MIAETLKRTVMALILGLTVGWFITLQPALSKRGAIEPGNDALSQRLAAHQRTAAGLAEQRRALETLSETVSQHPMRLPGQPDESGLISHLTALAADRDVRIIDIAPGETGETPRYRYQAITVRVQGRWEALVRLLTAIDATTRAVTATGLRLDQVEAEHDRRQLTMGISLNGHWQPDPVDDAATVAADSGWTQATGSVDTMAVPTPLRRDPFHPAIGTTPADSHDVAYLGRIMRGDAQWALIRDHNGQLHRWRVGDPVPGIGRLTRIGPQAITLEPVRSDRGGRPRIIHRHSGTEGTGD